MTTTNETWQKELRQNIRSVKDFNDYFEKNLTSDFPYDINIPLHIAKEIKENKSSVLIKQFMPIEEELENQNQGVDDPIGDQENSLNDGIVHRYNNRILFFPTSTCPVICRYCFRKNELSTGADVLKGKLKVLDEYLSKNLNINEVILSGGDPLVLSNQRILEILNIIKTHSSIKYLRFHTRTPVSLPSRITKDFIKTIKENKGRLKIVFSIHVNHASEITSDVESAFEKLSHFQLLSQTVLLKGINDCPLILKSLIYKLDQNSIRPYYLHHPDKVKGGMHFMVSKDHGQAIMRKLRKEVSGWLLPHYIQDNPSGKTVIA